MWNILHLVLSSLSQLVSALVVRTVSGSDLRDNVVLSMGTCHDLERTPVDMYDKRHDLTSMRLGGFEAGDNMRRALPLGSTC
jgi:hypothetical protein